MAFTEPRFTDDNAARKHLEAIRWPSGPICPHCGGIERNSALNGESHRPGLYFCGDCRTQFTVTVGTVFERSKIPLHKWVLATHLLCSSKKGMSSHQLHRIREAMRPTELAPFGQQGGGVEVDETFVGRDPKKSRPSRGPAQMHKVLSLIDRDTGRAYSMVVESLKAKEIIPILRANIAREASVLTDSATHYAALPLSFAKHGKVDHKIGEYVSLSDRSIHTNTIEGFFSIFKRGMRGTYQHCGKQHLHRYLAEFDFRYSNRIKLGIDDAQRADAALKGISGKRLTYRRINA